MNLDKYVDSMIGSGQPKEAGGSTAAELSLDDYVNEMISAPMPQAPTRPVNGMGRFRQMENEDAFVETQRPAVTMGQFRQQEGEDATLDAQAATMPRVNLPSKSNAKVLTDADAQAPGLYRQSAKGQMDMESIIDAFAEYNAANGIPSEVDLASGETVLNLPDGSQHKLTRDEARLYQERSRFWGKIKTAPKAQTEEEMIERAGLENIGGKSVAGDLMRNIAAGGSQGFKDIVGLGVRVLSDDAADELQRQSGVTERAAAELAKSSALPEFLQTGVRGVSRSVPQAFVGGGGAGAIALAGATSMNSAITKGRDAGLRGTDLAQYAGTEGAIEAGIAAIFQKMGLGGMEKGVSDAISGGLKSSLKEIVKRIGINGFNESREEIAITLASALNDRLSLPGAKEMNPAELAENAGQALLQSFMGVGSTEVATNAASVAKQSQKAFTDAIQPLTDWMRRNPEKAAELARIDGDTLSRQAAEEAGLDEILPERSTQQDRRKALELIRKQIEKNPDLTKMRPDETVVPPKYSRLDRVQEYEPSRGDEKPMSREEFDAEMQRVEDSTPNPQREIEDLLAEESQQNPALNKEQRRAELEAGMQGEPQGDAFRTRYQPPENGNLFGIPEKEMRNADWKAEASQRREELNAEPAPDKSAIGQGRLDYSGVQKVLEMRGDIPGEGMPTKRQIAEKLGVSREEAGTLLKQARVEDIVQTLQLRGESEPKARELAEFVQKGYVSLGEPGERPVRVIDALNAIPMQPKEAAKLLEASFKTKNGIKGSPEKALKAVLKEANANPDLELMAPEDAVAELAKSFRGTGLSKEAMQRRALEEVLAGPIQKAKSASGVLKAVDEEYEQVRTKGLPRDPKSNWPNDVNGDWMPKIFERAAESDKPVVFGDGDLGNIGGMNTYLGHQGTDKHLTEIFKIIREEMPGILITRRKGDELTFVGMDKTAEEMTAGYKRAQKRISDYAKNTTVETIEVVDKETKAVKLPAGTKMKLSEIPAGKKGGIAGTGLYSVFLDYEKGTDTAVYVKRLAESIEKEKAVSYGPGSARLSKDAGSDSGTVQRRVLPSTGPTRQEAGSREPAFSEGLQPRSERTGNDDRPGPDRGAATRGVYSEPDEKGSQSRAGGKALQTAVADKGIKGEIVLFTPKGGRKQRQGRVVGVNTDGSITVVRNGQQQIVAANDYSRLQKNTGKEELDAQRAEYDPESKRQIIDAAQDARKTSTLIHAMDLDVVATDAAGFGGARRKLAVNVEAKKMREKMLSQLGLTDVETDQAAALPKVLEKYINQQGEIPTGLKTVDAASDVGVGDVITLAGEKWKVEGVSQSNNRLRIVSPHGETITVPDSLVPKDKGTEIEGSAPATDSGIATAFESRIGETVSEKRNSGKRKGVVVETDLLGQETAKLSGPSGKADQQTMFDNEVSPELKKERKLRSQHTEEGGKELFGEDVQGYAAGPQIPMANKMDAGNVEPISNHEIIENLRKRFDVPIRTGHIARMGGIMPEGIYKRIQRVARNRVSGDIAPTVHEVAHHIDNVDSIVKNAPANIKQELATLDYQPHKARDFEGFAEFMRKYWTEDHKGQPAAFDVVKKWFESEVLPKNPKLAKNVQLTTEEIARYREQGAVQRVKESISDGGKTGSYKERAEAWFRKAYTAFKDKNYLVDLFQREAVKAGYTAPKGKQPYEVVKFYDQAGAALAQRAIDEGIFRTSDGKKIGQSFKSVLEGITPDNYENWRAFTKARHAREMLVKGMNPGISREDALHTYNQFKNEPHFEAAAKRLTDWNNALLDVLVDAGVKTQAEVDLMRQSWKTYIPMTRVHEGIFDGTGVGKSMIHNGVIKRRVGGGQATIDPIDATFQKTIMIYEAAGKQQAIEAIARAAVPNWEKGVKPAEGMGKFVERIPLEKLKNMVSIDQIRDQLKADGLDPQQVDAIPADRIYEYWTPKYQGDKNEGIVVVVKNGQKIALQIDPELYRVITGMDMDNLPFLIATVASAGTRAVKIGATGVNTSFTLKNWLRDTPVYFMATKRSWVDPSTWTDPFTMVWRYSVSEIRRKAGLKPDPLVKLWQDSGGQLATLFGRDRSELARKRDEVLADSKLRRAWQVVRNPLEAIQAILGVTEVGPRLAEFKGSLKKQGWPPERLARGEQPPMEVVIEALNAANDVTVNFKRMGNVGKNINRLVPFFNAPLEGTDKMLRTFKDDPAKAFFRGAALLTAPTIAYWLMRRDDPARDEEEDWLRQNFWTFTDKHLGMGDTGKPVLRIPIPEGYGYFFGTLPMALLDAAFEQSGKFLVDALKNADRFVPNIKPAIITPIIETGLNFKSLGWRPIVDSRMEKLEPKDQFTPYNTELSKKIGEYVNMSPAKIEHLLDGLSGGLYSGAERKVEAALGYRELAQNDVPFLGGVTFNKESLRSVNEFYEDHDKTEKAYNSAELRGPVPGELIDRKRRSDDYVGLIAEVRQPLRELKNADERNTIDRMIAGLARRALGKKDLHRYPNLFSAKELPKELETVRDEFLLQKAKTLTEYMPESLTEADLKKGRTIQHKQAEWKAKQAAAQSIIKELNVDKQAMSDLYFEWLADEIKTPHIRRARINRLESQIGLERK